MKRKHITAFIFCIFSMSAVIGWLYASSSLTEDVLRNSFNRLLGSGEYLQKMGEVDLRHNSFYLAGVDSQNVYLGNYTRPFLVTIINRATLKQERVSVQVANLDSIQEPGHFRLVVTPKKFYISHGVSPTILAGETGKWSAKKLAVDPHDYFDQNIPIGTKSFVQRYYNQRLEGYALAKMTLYGKADFQEHEQLLEKQREGVFSVDGKMHYDPKSNKLVYLYAYRNQFIVADSNLNLIYRGNTIDTFRIARVHVANIKSDNSTMISAPAAQINKESYVADNKLFIESNLLAKNEDSRLFRNNSTIDVYDLTTRRYAYSFYIEGRDNKKMSDFLIDNNKLYAIIDRTLVAYTMGGAK